MNDGIREKQVTLLHKLEFAAMMTELNFIHVPEESVQAT
jgi:hypothetical protein